MNAYTVEDYRAAAKRAMAAGDQTTAKSLIARGMALQPQGPETGSASGDLRAGMLQAQMVIPGVRANKHLDIIQNAQTGNLSQGNFAQNAQYLLDLAKSYEADLNLLEDPDERATLADQIADLRNQAANIQSTAATPTAQNTQASLDAAAGRSAQTLATDVLPNLMDLQRRTSEIPMSAKAQEMFNPEGDTFLQQTGDVFATFREAPGEITRTVFLRSLPAMIPTVAAAIAGTAVGGPAAGGTLAGLVGGSTELGIALSQELTQELGSRGVNVEDPNAVKAWSEANPELITDMLMNARKRALAIGTVDAATGLVTGRIAKAANQGGKLRKGAGVIAGGTVGAVGEGLGESAALQAEGKEQNPGEIAGEMLGAGPMIAGQTAGQMAVQKTRNLFTSKGTLADPTTLEESYRGAAGDVARQLQELAKANGYNLKDIDNSSEGGAKQALEDLRQGNNETITGLVAVLKPLLSPKNAKSLEDLLLNYTQASAGIKGAKKKVSSRVTQDQLDAARRLVGGLKEGQELLNALQKSNVITDLFKRGVQGGVSRFTDLFNPISMAGAGYNAPKIAANAMLGSGLPVITQGGTIPAQGALWVMGRLTDAMTGRRSKVARFVRQNTGKFGLPTPKGPSIIAAEQLKAQKAEASKNQAKEIRASLAQFNTKMNVADFEQSPIGNFLFRTGLDKQGLIDVVNMMSKDPDIANDPGMLALIDQINENLAGGENQIEALSDAVLAVGAYAQENAPELIKFQPDSPSLLRSFDPSASPEVSSGAPQQPTQGPQQSGRQFTSPENYQAGIDANIELADTLQSTLSADPDVSVTDKGQLLSVLEGLKQPLTNPTVQLQTDIEALQRNDVSSEAIDKYVRPYLDRVTNQRDQRSRLQRLQDAPKKPTSTQTEAPTPTEAMTEAPVVPQTAGEMVAEGSIIEGAVRAISEGTMAPESVDAMLSSLEASTPGIRAKIEAIVNRQPPEGPALRQQDDRDLEADLSSPALPALSSPNPLQIPESDLQATNLPIMPSSEEIVSMREGSYKPDQKRTLVEAAEFLNNRWQAATGQTEPFEYTPENVDRISSMMATEAIEALKNDSNAIGWYDRKIKAAKAVTALVEPRIMQSPDAEAAFDFALAVTSNGQAVADNFAYTVEVFRYFMDNGKMPTDTWNKGGERNGAMVEAFNFFNAYNASGRNMPIQDFLSTDFTVAELDNLIKQFNAETGSTVSVPSSESRQASVKGSYIMGPKIGQGFYQNIRGNYDPLTMDIWWMRMWNRMVGRPFEASKDVDKNRARIREAVKTKNQTDLEKRLTKAALKDLAITRAALTDDEVLDQFVANVESKYQSYYRKKSAELKGTGNKVPKPELFKASGTMVKNMKPQLQAQPKGPGERQYMREVTQAALAKLKSQGYPITTADFQALMWYPEKQLFRKLGVAPGRGADNDYLDAAKLLAAKEGIPNERIEETLGTSGPDGAVASGASPTEAQGALRGDADRSGREETTADDREAPALSDFIRNGPSQLRRALSRRVPSKQEVVGQFPAVKALFEIGKKGSPYENGITNIEDALTLAKALGITVHMFNDHQKMLETLGADSQTLRGRFVKTSNGASGHVFALEPGTDYRGRNLTDIEALTTLLHEIFHGVTMGPMSGVGPMLNGNGNGTPSVENAVGAMIDKPQGKRTPQERKIMREITRLQNSLSAYVEGKPTERRPVRGLIAAMDNFDQQRNQMTPEEQMDFENKIDAHVKYIRSKGEFSVDPFWVYAVNPKMAKLVMPETTKWIRGELRKAGNKDIQFFTHPLAISIAVVMALMASEQAEDEQREEQQRQQMQPGALSPTAGMLSAA